MKRVLSMILALVLVFSVFALTACGDQGTTAGSTPPPMGGTSGTNKPAGNNGTTAGSNTPDNTSSSATLESTTTGTTGWDPGDKEKKEAIREGFEDVDFSGYTFTFASPINDTDGWHDYEVYAEEDGEGILDAAINERNNLLLEHYDCFVEVEDINEGNLTTDFATGTNHVDIALYKYNMQSKASTNYYNFYDLGLDLEKPWWDQGYIEDATVNGQIYTMLGAFSLTSFDATWVMFFNKDVQETNENLRGINFYDLVYDNEWTLDKFFELVKYAYHDDGDQTATLGGADVFGLVSSTFGIRGLYFGADQGYITKTTAADKSTTFAHAFTTAASEATDKVIEIYAHDATQLTDYKTVEAQMRSNGVLFSPEVLRKASYYAGKQGESTEPVSIGVLPHPKLSADQNGYKHNVDNHVIYMCIPTTCADVERMTDFLELYAYHSYFTVYNSYLNLYKYTYTTDTDSAKMVDEILQSRSFDLAYQYGFASIDGEYIKGVQEGSNVIAELGGQFGEAIVTAANTYRDKLPGNNK